MGNIIASAARTFKVTVEFVVETLKSLFQHFFDSIKKLSSEFSRFGGTTRFSKATKRIFVDGVEHVLTICKNRMGYSITAVNTKT